MRTVLITGGSRGIGASIAAEFAANGWKVIAPPPLGIESGGQIIRRGIL